MFKQLSISQKLVLSYLLIGILAVVLLSFFFYKAFENALMQRTSAQLSSINMLKKLQLEDHFRARRRNLEILCHNPVLVKAASYLKAANKRTAQSDSIQAHRTQLLDIQREHNYQAMVLLNTNFDVLYPISDSITVLQKILRNYEQKPKLNRFLHKARHGYARIDYLPADSVVKGALLVAHPLIGNKNDTIGIVVFQKHFTHIEHILYERTGMGQTGESYIVGDDFRMRSHSRFFPDSLPVAIHVNTQATRNAIAGLEKVEIIKDYRNVPVVSAYRRLDVPGLNWVIVSEIDLEEAMQPVYIVRDRLVLIGIIITLLIVAATYLLAETIARPVRLLRNIILQLAKGVLPEKPLAPTNNDEISQMKTAINTLVDGLRRKSDFAGQIGQGHFEARYQPLSSQDSLGISLLQMRDNLVFLKQQEISLTQERTTALVEGQEKERKRIARELHDGICQMLTATRFRVGALDCDKDELAEVKTLIDDTLTEIKRISNNLMPSVLIDFGLEAALNMLCQHTSKLTGLTIHVDFGNDGSLPAINFETSVAIYRIVQEGLNNIIKYAKASQAELILTHDQHAISLCLQDNGQGFDLAILEQKGFLGSNGIRNMSERAKLVGGTVKVESLPGKGTMLTAYIPLEK